MLKFTEKIAEECTILYGVVLMQSQSSLFQRCKDILNFVATVLLFT